MRNANDTDAVTEICPNEMVPCGPPFPPPSMQTLTFCAIMPSRAPTRCHARIPLRNYRRRCQPVFLPPSVRLRPPYPGPFSVAAFTARERA
jgi:hypothetical protein